MPFIRRAPVRPSLLAILAGLFVAVVGPPAALAQPSLPVQIIVSSIGDFDCFGYGAPQPPIDPASPCGTLPAAPVQGASDPSNTDITIACPPSSSSPSTITFTHTFTLPPGATILGAIWATNAGGIEKATFNTLLTLEGIIPVPVPDTGPLGTALILVPLPPPLSSTLADGKLVVRFTRASATACDDVFVDGAWLAILVRAT